MVSPRGCGTRGKGRSSGGARGEPLSLYTFDDVQVDTAGFRVERGGQAVPLEPKAFDLLVLLLERHGHVVTKQEILDTVWRQTAVTDNALTRIVAHLRKALGDDARDARYIETVPTRGYRWLAPVERRDGGLLAASVVATPAVSVARAASPRRAWARARARRPRRRWARSSFAYRRGLTREEEPPGLRVMWPTQVTNSPSLDAFPALSPNGLSVAYASDRTGGFEIVVSSLAAGATEMALTADGQQNVAARVVAGRPIRGLSLDAARRDLDRARPGRSRPTGDRVRVRARLVPGRSAAGLPVGSPRRHRARRLWRQRALRRSGRSRATAATGGASRRRRQPMGGHASPAWSPDGRRIVFATYSAAPSRAVVGARRGRGAGVDRRGARRAVRPRVLSRWAMGLLRDGRAVHRSRAGVARDGGAPRSSPRPSGRPRWPACGTSRSAATDAAWSWPA